MNSYLSSFLLVALVFLPGFAHGNDSVCHLAAATNAASASPSSLQSKVRIVKSVEMPIVTRRAIGSALELKKDDIARFREAIRVLRTRCKYVDENSLCDKNSTILNLHAYEALRAKHGIPNAEKILPSLPVATLGICTSSVNGPWDECVHDQKIKEIESPLFLLWHRAFVRSLEITINSILWQSWTGDKAKFVPIGVPYWNWLASPALPPGFRCPSDRVKECKEVERARREDLEVVSGSYSPPGGIRPYENALFVFNRGLETRRNDSVWQRSPLHNPFADKSNDFVEFNYDFRSTWHDQIHTGVGVGRTETSTENDSKGWMTYTDYAVLDPVFWVHHSFSDYLMDKWVERSLKFGQISVAKWAEQMKWKELEKLWLEKKYSFPVVCGSEVVWYRPSFDQVDPLARAEQRGYKYLSDDDIESHLDSRRDEQSDVAKNAIVDYPFLSKKFVPIFLEQISHAPISSLEFSPSYTVEVRQRVDVPYTGNIVELPLGAVDAITLLQHANREVKDYVQYRLPSTRRKVLLSFEDALLYTRPSSSISVLVAARMCTSLLRCDDPKDHWSYVGVIGAFGLPTRSIVTNTVSGGAQPEYRVGESWAGHASQAMDITAPVIEGIRKFQRAYPLVNRLANDSALQIAIFPITLTTNGSLPVNNKDFGLEFRSIKFSVVQ